MKSGLLIERLRERCVSLGIKTETLDRLALALTIPASLDELEEALPPAVRYLGPGAWADTIEKTGASNEVSRSVS
ncbi:MAG: hypothetical protein LBI85_01005 [Spirochaetaceae bacterium]|jgi:hypothetical protein|nr:hypothetical protein [Spirochaetaceae bacterium]